MGLPPGPIAIPSRAAIEAAKAPMETDDVFFVATGSGGHNFSRTLQEHNRNVDAYRAKVGRPRSAAAAPQGSAGARPRAAQAGQAAAKQTAAKPQAKQAAAKPQARQRQAAAKPKAAAGQAKKK
jgi:hypothetical protein